MRNVAGLNAKFPDGDDPFQIMTRLCEEAGELAQAVNHAERSGIKVEKYGPPDLVHLADEVHHVLRVALAVVAVDADGREFFQSGKATKVRNYRTMQATKRVQRKLATKKAEGADSHGVRRVLKRLSGRRKRRTHDFACVTAKRLIEWAPADAVLVFEDLRIEQPSRDLTRGAARRRRLSSWQYSAIRQAVTNKAQMAGVAITTVNPAYTSQNCSRCGLRGKRHRHQFTCPSCGHAQHADVNAAINIRTRYVQFRLDGALSTAPEALPRGEGKLSAKAGGR